MLRCPPRSFTTVPLDAAVVAEIAVNVLLYLILLYNVTLPNVVQLRCPPPGTHKRTYYHTHRPANQQATASILAQRPG
jgi:hypothetical protein